MRTGTQRWIFQGASPAEVIDLTPELREQAQAILAQYDHGPLFTPPSERGTVLVPGVGGGANWAGAAYDPDTGRLYVPSVTAPSVVTLSPPPAGSINDRYVGRLQRLRGPQGLPLFKPPFGRLTAIAISAPGTTSGWCRWVRGRGTIRCSCRSSWGGSDGTAAASR